MFIFMCMLSQFNLCGPHGLWPARLLCPWNYPRENIGVDCHYLLQGIFLIHELNSGLLYVLHWQVDSLPMSRLGNPLSLCIRYHFNVISQSVQLLSCVRLFTTPWTEAHQAASLFITNTRSLLRLMSTELMMPFNRLILCRPLLLLPSIPPSIRVFSNESVLCIRWPKYWSFSFSISPSNESSGLISFMDWFDLLALQGTLGVFSNTTV